MVIKYNPKLGYEEFDSKPEDYDSEDSDYEDEETSVFKDLIEESSYESESDEVDQQ